MITSEWRIEASDFSKTTLNPLRILWERHQPHGNPLKSSIILQAGDPTTFGNFPPHPIALEAIKEAVDIDKFGYHQSAGLEIARQAIAEHSKHRGDVTSEDVFLASGGSMTIEMCVRALANPGDNILVPRPAWNYTTWICGSDIEAIFYNLKPERDWEVDLDHLESMINEKTRGIILNSPGNPCGNVFSREHILDILKVAERHHLPIISDEIYEFFTFPGVEFHSIASLSKNVPVLTCSGTAKILLMPGNRIGWIIVNDRGNKLTKIREALKNIVGRNFMPNSTFQIALAKMLREIPEEFYDDSRRRVATHAQTVYDELKTVRGLNPIMPKGSMYMMIQVELEKFPEFDTSLSFMRHLAMEQSVFTLPSEGFNFPGFLRVVLTAPQNILLETCERMREFCKQHYQDQK